MLEFIVVPLFLAIVAAIVCGVVGTLTVVRSSTYVAGAVSHTILAGLGFAQYSNTIGLLPFYLPPDVAALVTAVGVAIIISILQFNGKVKQDTTLSAVWAIGMAVGLLFLSITPGYQTDLLRYMFGSIAFATMSEVYFVLVLALLIVSCCYLFWRGILASCFNANLLRLNGGRAFFFELLISIMSAVAIVVLVKTVGIVLVIALITLPSMAALGMRLSLWMAMLVSGVLAFIALAFGIVVSIYFDIEAAAPTVICIATVAMLIKLLKRGKLNDNKN